MRAALMERGEIRLGEVPDPTPADGEVVVKSLACGICGSDLHAARHTEEFVATSIEAGGAFKLTTFDPVVLGHEFCAEVMETTGTRTAGDLVCSVPVLPRGPNVPVGYSPAAPGGFGEYMLLAERLLVPVPAGTGSVRAALTEPFGRRPPRGQHGAPRGWRSHRGHRRRTGRIGGRRQSQGRWRRPRGGFRTRRETPATCRSDGCRCGLSILEPRIPSPWRMWPDTTMS